MIRIALLSFLAFSLLGAPPKKTRQAQKAHEHGSANINIAVEGKTAVIEFEAPAEGIVGFEHQARTAAQKKQQEAALATLRNRVSEIVVFELAAACKFTPRTVEVEQEAGEDHSEVKAEFAADCAQPLGGTAIRFGVTKVFPQVGEVTVQVLNGSQQADLKVTNDRGSINLSK